MIEPSPRCKRSLTKLVNDKKFVGQFKFLQRIISSPNQNYTDFFDRPHMGGSCFSSSKEDKCVKIKPLTKNEVFDNIGHSYELLKCDIEGSEWDLLKNYSHLFLNAKFVILEWHSWHSGNGGIDQIIKKLESLNFKIIKKSKPTKAIGRSGEVGLLLAKNQIWGE